MGLRGFYIIASLVLGLDILTKQIVYRNLVLGGPSVEVVGDWLRWTYIHNGGAASGLFQGHRIVFLVVSVLSPLVILGLANHREYRRPWTLAALGLILGGAFGNLLDRIWLGVVIDFIDCGVGHHRWPFFNIADSGITVGVVLLASQLLRGGGEDPTMTVGDELS